MWGSRHKVAASRTEPIFALAQGEGVRRRLFEIHGERVTLGSSADCDICIRDGNLAPVQVEIEQTGGRLLLFHRGGEVPTRVDGHPSPVAHLDGGERLTLGTLSVRVIRVSHPHAAPPAADSPVILTRQTGPRSLREALQRGLHRSPSLFLSGIIHLIVLFLLSQVDVTEARRDPLHLTASLSDDRPAEIDALTPPPTDEVPTELEEPLDDREISDPMPPGLTDARESDLRTDAAIDSPVLDQFGLGAGGGRSGLPGIEGLPAGVGRRFRTRAGELRARGLDIAIVFDSTLSMSDFVDEVKRDIAAMINVIGAVVPDSRMALVTYKGTPDLSPVLLTQDFTADRYEIINFLDEIDSRGGAADARSALAQGLRFTVRDLHWRPMAEQVIVLIGDAPPFIEGRPVALAWARRFGGRLATIYKASGGLTEQQHREETIDVMRTLAAESGEFALYDGDGSAVRRLVYAALGTQYAESIDRVFAARTDRWHEHAVGRRIAERNYEWLFGQLARRHVHPAIVDGLIGLSSPYVTQRCFVMLQNVGHDEPWMLSRLVHILRRITGRPELIAYDPTAPRWFRTEQLERIRTLIGSPREPSEPQPRSDH